MRGQFKILLAISVLGLCLSSARAFQSSQAEGRYTLNEDWVVEARAAAEVAMWRNISPAGTERGAVIASPSKSDPNYFYHWVRDAGITMLEVVELLSREPFHPDTNQRIHAMMEFIEFSRRNQLYSGFDSLGEPKYEVNGRPFRGPWGRPQNDGPGMRAYCLSRFAEWMIWHGRYEIVENKVLPVLLADLEYLEIHRQQTSFDLWEEVRGHHFYTQNVQIAGLNAGAEILFRIGRKTEGLRYQNVAKQIAQEIPRHIHAKFGYIAETLHRDEGLDYKHQNLDTGTILGVLHAGPWAAMAVDADAVILTAQALERRFSEIYEINFRYPGVPPAIGRYPEDQYYGGNPWFLTTLAFAEWNYQMALKIKRSNQYTMTAVLQNYLSRQGKETYPTELTGASKEQVVKELVIRGDQYLERVRLHQGPGFNMAEQLDRYSGFMRSARDLTWSYVAFLSAVRAREDIKGLIND